MDKVGSPRGLIRYATQNALTGRWSAKRQLARVFRPRVLVYGTVMLVITAAFVTSLVMRQPFRFDLVRDRAALARIVGHGDIENVYRLQLMNSTERVQRYRVAVAGLDGATLASAAEFDVGPAEARWWPVAVRLPAQAALAQGPGVHALRIEVERLADADAPAAHVTEKSTFVVPR
jgi:polyferredoxin